MPVASPNVEYVTAAAASASEVAIGFEASTASQAAEDKSLKIHPLETVTVSCTVVTVVPEFVSGSDPDSGSEPFLEVLTL